jgi:hypothetical protein
VPGAIKKKPKPKAGARDIAILQGPTEDGQGARLLRFRGDTVTAGEIRPVREGQPLAPFGSHGSHGPLGNKTELVRLKPLHHELPVCEVEVLHASSNPEASAKIETDAELESAPTRSGPARVSTRRYRRNWSAVFGEKAEREPEPGRRRGPDYSVN